MKNKNVILTLLLIFLIGMGGVTQFIAASSETSSAGVKFIQNPKLPLYPEDVEVETTEFPLEKDKSTDNLPQTSEKIVSPVYGMVILVVALTLWYFRRKLLENKKQIKKHNNGGN